MPTSIIEKINTGHDYVAEAEAFLAADYIEREQKRAKRRALCGLIHFKVKVNGRFIYVAWRCHDYRECEFCRHQHALRTMKGIQQNTLECDGIDFFEHITDEQIEVLIADLPKSEYLKLPQEDRTILMVKRGVLSEKQIKEARGVVFEHYYLKDLPWDIWCKTPEKRRMSGQLKRLPEPKLPEGTTVIMTDIPQAIADAPPDVQEKIFNEAAKMTPAHPTTPEELIEAVRARTEMAIERFVYYGWTVKVTREPHKEKITSNDIRSYFNTLEVNSDESALENGQMLTLQQWQQAKKYLEDERKSPED